MTEKSRSILVCACISVVVIVLVTGLLINSNEDKDPEDFSKMTWTEAFGALNGAMSKEYAFTEWKGIEWQELYDKYIQDIESAQENGSFEEYYLALHSYIHEIRDGHVSISSFPEIDKKYIGGYFGFNVSQLDNGRILVTWIDPEGPAAEMGIVVGDEIVMWDDRPVNDALESVSTIFTGIAASDETLKQKKLSFLVRGPIDSDVRVTFSDSRSLVLKAYDDQKGSILKSYPYTVVPMEKLMAISAMLDGEPNPEYGPESIVETEKLDGNILYVKLWALLDLDTGNTGTPESTAELMRKAVAYANESKCTGMVLDLRNNIGGLDEMVAEILGLFCSERTFYEYQKLVATGEMTEVYIEPEQLHYSGNIIALINYPCVSSGEGVAMGIENLDNGETLGFYGTNASFGMTGGMAKMPGGIFISYPVGQSLDQNMVVQLDSKDGVGGVSPSIRIPMNEENALLVASGFDVELEEALRILRGD